ncbi:MAG: 5-formyltetrahydrofolate cyclo-ligase [Candidatus Omnitrophica bacterium]|nr:5-formyltetrahydrofolate cyclo-ligase [Candidatus Omnitrophota bacterium]
MAPKTKQGLRQRVLDLIKSHKEEDAFQKSRVIAAKFATLPAFVTARTVLFYVSCRGEVDTFGLMRQALDLHKCVAVPVVVKDTKQIVPIVIRSLDELKPGTYGIPEPPVSAERILKASIIDLVVVPGIAFDRRNNRLGRGAGYYDRFLADIPLTTPVVGLAYDFQLVDEIPQLELHDRPVTTVLTD